MSARRVRATFVAASLTTVVAFGLAAPASAAPAPAPALAGSFSAQAAGQLSARDPFPKMTAAKILAKSAASAKAAKTVRVHETVKTDAGTITVDAVLTRTAGQAKVSKGAAGTFTVIRQGKALYFSGDTKFWTALAQGNAEDLKLVSQLAGKWLQLTGSGGASKDLLELTTLSSLTKDIAAYKAAKRVPGTAVRGKATVGLSGTDEGVPAVLYVAAAGAPYPVLEVANDRSISAGYSDWNKSMKVSKPKAAVAVPATVLPSEVLFG